MRSFFAFPQALCLGGLLLFTSCSGGSEAAQVSTPIPPPSTPVVFLAIAVHSEDKYNPGTPDYTADKAAYVSSRAGLLAFAQAMASRQLTWNWQSDYNFLEACLKWEIQNPDGALLALTNGKNVARYLREELGVECDPHSHEHDGYNYADVAYLLQACGVTPAPVVGGHIYDLSDPGYQNWPRFNAGINGQRNPSYFWKPELLMGAGTGQHRNDPTASGIWRPVSASAYFSTGGGGVATFGGWDNQISSLPGLAQKVASGQLDPARMWTFTLVLIQRDFAQVGNLQTQVIPLLDQVVALRSAGSAQVVQLAEAMDLWRTRYGSAEAVYQPSGGTAPGSRSTRTAAGPSWLLRGIRPGDPAF